MSTKPQTAINKQALVQVFRDAVAQGDDLDQLQNKVEKMAVRSKVSRKKETQEEQKKEEKLKKSLPKIIRTGAFILPIFFIAIGFGLIANAVVPISRYYLETLPQLSIFDLKTPIPRESVLDITPAVIAQASNVSLQETNSQEDFGPVIIDTELDYTNLANWFNIDNSSGFDSEKTGNIYTLDIPQVDVANAQVLVGGTELDDSLIQYPGTADPGKPGAPVIFGHSVLRQFYNPSEKNPRRYISIFSKIMTLKNGDEIYLEKDGVKYTYKVSDKTEVKPDDVHILTQNYDARKLKLVTCVPEGTYLRRGVVTAELVE